MDNTNNTVVNQKDQKGNKNIEQKLKESIKKYYTQLKTGCYRTLCYNDYCKKGKGKFLLFKT